MATTAARLLSRGDSVFTADNGMSLSGIPLSTDVFTLSLTDTARPLPIRLLPAHHFAGKAYPLPHWIPDMRCRAFRHDGVGTMCAAVDMLFEQGVNVLWQPALHLTRMGCLMTYGHQYYRTLCVPVRAVRTGHG